jgi:peroxiredoxin Q/BCP
MTGSHLKAGDAAPEFELLDQHGARVRSGDFRGRSLLVYFYPVALSEDCTEQGCSIRDHRSGLTSLGVDVVGISPDLVAKQREFDDRYTLGFPLLADIDHSVADRYGVWTDYEYAGSIVTGVLRSSFLLDGDGVITHAWSPVLASDTATNVIAAIGP